MKTDFTKISECRQELNVEIPADTVEKAIERLSKGYGRTAKIPGFRPGKVPAQVIRARFREQLLHDAAQELVPKAVDDALASSALTPIATPDVQDVNINEGQPLTFRATFDTLPTVDPGRYDDFTLRQTPVSIDEDAVTKAMDQLQLRASRLDPIEGRNIEHGDTVTLDLERRLVKQPTDSNNDSSTEPEQHRDVSVEIGHASNPPGFDEELIGLKVGDTSSFTVAFPEDYEVSSFAGAEAAYEIQVKQARLRILPVLDDDFAKQAGDFENLAALRTKVETDLNQQAETEAKNDVRQDLLRQLAGRLTTDVPEALILQEIERRVEQLARHMMNQNIDPREANIDWNAFREQQRVAATEAVRSTLMLDAIVSREEINLTDEDITKEIEHQAEASGRAPSAIRAFIEKDGSIDRLRSGLAREKAIELLLSRSTIVTA